MKREFPSTPDEAFESLNEGLYYGRLLVSSPPTRTYTKGLLRPKHSVHTAWI
jgi:hypothetical protein